MPTPSPHSWAFAASAGRENTPHAPTRTRHRRHHLLPTRHPRSIRPHPRHHLGRPHRTRPHLPRRSTHHLGGNIENVHRLRPPNRCHPVHRTRPHPRTRPARAATLQASPRIRRAIHN